MDRRKDGCLRTKNDELKLNWAGELENNNVGKNIYIHVGREKKEQNGKDLVVQELRRH